MDDSRFRCTIEARDGLRRRVGPQGLLIGREPGSDILITDPSVSRRHALIRIGPDGAELVPLGRLAVLYNGAPCERGQLLADGDRIGVADQEFVVQLETAPAPQSASYLLVRGGSSYGISHTPFVVGGGATDDLILSTLPPSALVFHLAQRELFVEKDGELEPIAVGETIECGDETFSIASGGDRAHTTITGSINALPSKVIVEMLPRGGRVVFAMPTGDVAVYLADRRLDLIMALVKPPQGFAPGDYIPDDVLRPIVWPRNPNVIRSEINVHITRCRRDLLAAGLPGPRLLQRSPTGGATRLALAANCVVTFL